MSRTDHDSLELICGSLELIHGGRQLICNSLQLIHDSLQLIYDAIDSLKLGNKRVTAGETRELGTEKNEKIVLSVQNCEDKMMTHDDTHHPVFLLLYW